jgi:pimeloyl-ACP methyl ester carboxylesterase
MISDRNDELAITAQVPGRADDPGSAVRAPLRMSFFFSAGGDRAAFLRDAGGPGLGVETWAWRGGAPRRRIISTGGESLYSQPLPLDDDRVLVLRSGAGVHHLVLLTPGQDETTIGRIESRGLHLLPSHEAGTLAVARGIRDNGRATLWIIKAASPHIQAVPGPGLLAGALQGGHWLDDAGRMLGFGYHAGGRSRILAVDLATGAIDLASFPAAEPAQSGAGDMNYHLLLSERRSGRFLAARQAGGEVSLGWGRWDREGWELAFPEGFGAFDGKVTPLAIAPAGRAVAFCVENGLRSEVHIRTPGQREHQRLDLPAGTILPTARWTSGGLHLVTSGPDRPANITTVTPGTGRPRADADPSPTGGWASAHADVMAGPAGPIEAVIYGGPRWRDAERLLIALHGGPHAAWKPSFDPFLQDLAAAGVAVVAPNQRGSTGYGQAHRDAIRGAWGGPDLSDIEHLAVSVSAYRRAQGLPRLMLLGVSYGAFLALLAAAAAPGLWSHCAAISPFCSADSLYAAGPESVRSFLRRLGALDVIDDALGPRDLERLADRITARLLIVHGTRDEKIPVSQPRRIVAALERVGRRSGNDFIYRETPGGHDLIHGTPDEELRRQLVDFLAHGDLVLAGKPDAQLERSS